MKTSIKKGLGFGLTSGIITTLGMIIGLNFSTYSVKVVVSGILIIAIADALSDAMGIHISEETEKGNSHKEIWESTISTFVFKAIFALTFVVPFLLFELSGAVIVSVIWGLLLISLFSLYIAKQNNMNLYKVIGEHLLITIIVIILTYFLGIFVGSVF